MLLCTVHASHPFFARGRLGRSLLRLKESISDGIDYTITRNILVGHFGKIGKWYGVFLIRTVLEHCTSFTAVLAFQSSIRYLQWSHHQLYVNPFNKDLVAGRSTDEVENSNKMWCTIEIVNLSKEKLRLNLMEIKNPCPSGLDNNWLEISFFRIACPCSLDHSLWKIMIRAILWRDLSQRKGNLKLELISRMKQSEAFPSYVSSYRLHDPADCQWCISSRSRLVNDGCLLPWRIKLFLIFHVTKIGEMQSSLHPKYSMKRCTAPTISKCGDTSYAWNISHVPFIQVLGDWYKLDIQFGKVRAAYLQATIHWKQLQAQRGQCRFFLLQHVRVTQAYLKRHSDFFLYYLLWNS